MRINSGAGFLAVAAMRTQERLPAETPERCFAAIAGCRDASASYSWRGEILETAPTGVKSDSRPLVPSLAFPARVGTWG